MSVVLTHLFLWVVCLVLNFTLNPFPVETIIVYVLYVVISSLISYRSLSRSLNRVDSPDRSGFIYVFSDLGNIVPAVKIGRETVKGSRLLQHRTAAPLGIITYCNFRVPDAVQAESLLHRRYASLRINSRNEWFCVTPRLMVDILLIRLFRS